MTTHRGETSRYSQLGRRLRPLNDICGQKLRQNTPSKTRLLAIYAERLVYLSERGTRCIVICLEFAERRLEFMVKGEDDVDLTSAQSDVNNDQT
jgi:hypothetical protein